MLQEGVMGGPAKGLGEVLGAHGLIAVLQLRQQKGLRTEGQQPQCREAEQMVT